jgi:putative FmdB family regulatory protein
MIYEFKCLECGTVFDRLLTVKQKEKAKKMECPKCNKTVKVKAQVGRCNFRRFWETCK